MTDNTTPVKEIKIPVADPNDPYAIPAAMPSSVDHAVRSFNAGDYPEPAASRTNGATRLSSASTSSSPCSSLPAKRRSKSP